MTDRTGELRDESNDEFTRFGHSLRSAISQPARAASYDCGITRFGGNDDRSITVQDTLGSKTDVKDLVKRV